MAYGSGNSAEAVYASPLDNLAVHVAEDASARSRGVMTVKTRQKHLHRNELGFHFWVRTARFVGGSREKGSTPRSAAILIRTRPGPTSVCPTVKRYGSGRRCTDLRSPFDYWRLSYNVVVADPIVNADLDFLSRLFLSATAATMPRNKNGFTNSDNAESHVRIPRMGNFKRCRFDAGNKYLKRIKQMQYYDLKKTGDEYGLI